jgi:phosphoribosylaminoimidazole-succinocarboxamide synthase
MLTAESFVRSGKVRDLFYLPHSSDRPDLENVLVLVASDRISAFDVVLPTPIPDKGRVLTGLSRFWFDETAEIIPNHLLAIDLPAVVDRLRETLDEARDRPPGEVLPTGIGSFDDWRGRSLVCRHAAVLPVELVVRGYLSGSGWKEYLQNGAVCGVPLPPLLAESERLPEPILTPATKAAVGEHDINIDLDSMVSLLADWAPNGDDWLGEAAARDLANRAREAALALYAAGAARCAAAGIVLADTKFEMGLVDGELVLVDEVLTPDSSRFWDAATYAPGGPQASFDKQFVRDWLDAQGWDRTPPGPELPADVVAGTRARYVEAFERITGASFDRYLEEDVIDR